jgi:hypothetical protein
MIFKKITEQNKFFRNARIFKFDLYVAGINRCGKVITYEYRRLKRDKKNWKNRQEKKLLNEESLDNFRTRFISITTSYILTICNLEDIFSRFSKEIIKFYCSNVKVPTMPLNEPIIEKIDAFNKDIEDYRFYRDKVYAHTAYIKPLKEDTEVLKDTTMQMYANGSMSLATDGYFMLGGVSVGYSSESVKEIENARKNKNYLDQIIKSTPKRIDLINDYPNVQNHFREWETFCSHLLGFLYEIH